MGELGIAWEKQSGVGEIVNKGRKSFLRFAKAWRRRGRGECMGKGLWRGRDWIKGEKDSEGLGRGGEGEGAWRLRGKSIVVCERVEERRESLMRTGEA